MDTATHPSPAEYWRADAGADSVATLVVPGLLSRARTFDVDVSLLVDVPASHDGAWHELSVELDGRLQWSRRIPSHNPGQTDGLDYHHRLRLEAGQSVRVRAQVKLRGVRVRQLLIEAREER